MRVIAHVGAGLLILLVATASAGHGQEPAATGTVAGQVVDGRNDAAVAGIRVDLTGAGVSRAMTSGDDGRFLFPGLPVGDYTLRAHVPGAQALERQVRVTPGGTTSVRVDVAQAVMTLDPLLAMTSPVSTRPGETEFGVRIGAQALRLLPMSWDPAALAGLAPGVTGDRIWGGAAREANLYQVDGMTLTHPGSGGYLVPLSPSWVEEVEVRGLGSGADVGNFQGGVVNLVTRSGGEDARSSIRTAVETAGLNASHDIANEISRERSLRADVEGDWSGPLRPGRVHLFAGGHVLRDEYRARSHLPGAAGLHLPHRETRTELRGLARLTWTPDRVNRLDGTLVLARTDAANWALTGYEAAGVAPDYSAPARMVMLGWQRLLGSSGRLDVRASHATTHEEWRAPAGPAVPAVRLFVFGDPPSPVWGNAPFEVERKPSLASLTATLAGTVRTGPFRHDLNAGVELSRASWLDRRVRTGGMTWRPARTQQLDPADPATWPFGGYIPSDWGGDVHLDARTSSSALFVQDRITVHPRLWLTAGLRATTWRGDVLPLSAGPRRFTAVDVSGLDPRVGIVADAAGGGDVLLKAHWGRYHQNLLAPMFDRVAGGEVFSDRELWYYAGPAPADPATRFSRGQRDALALAAPGEPRFILQEIIRLNESGPVADDYRQPHMDQWLAGVEAAIGSSVRVEAAYVHRRYRDLVALMDRNIDQYYHAFHDVEVRTLDGEPILLGDGPMTLPVLYVPRWAILRQLQYIAGNAAVPMPPGFTLADIPALEAQEATFSRRDFVLGNPSDAWRRLHQVQLTARLARPAWGAWLSLALSDLRGNLDAVTGYEAGTGYDRYWEIGAGPWVRPNEATGAEGRLPGVPPIEFKAAVHGQLPWSVRGGLMLEARRGEYFTPFLTLSGLGHTFFTEGGEVGVQMVTEAAGQRVFIGERGSAHYADRVTLDMRVERDLPLGGGDWRFTADVFNLWNADTATRINPSMTWTSTRSGPFTTVPEPAVFRAVWERLPPRTLRLGIARSTGS
ncbi:MAG TPA: TonB-dependent receptor [Longimicrobiales bacterium]|nr:TonB-dependent receptor [Longimicrobiales bacterium]